MPVKPFHHIGLIEILEEQLWLAFTNSGICASKFKETTTLGIRRSTTSREILPRREVPVITPLGTVRIKVVYLENKWRYTPEYEDCRQIALRKSIPLADVYAAVHEKAGHMNLGKTS